MFVCSKGDNMEREVEVLKEIIAIANDDSFSEFEALEAIVEIVEDRFAEMEIDPEDEELDEG
jgi:hypothetical protein